MKNIQNIKFQAGSREELLPGFSTEFPYIATRAELDRYAERFVPWHWHEPVELFYMESGALEYCTPGGMVNSNVLHMTRVVGRPGPDTQLLHIFDPSFLAGELGSRIGQRYVAPLTGAPQIELLPLLDAPPIHCCRARGYAAGPVQRFTADPIHSFLTKFSQIIPGFFVRPVVHCPCQEGKPDNPPRSPLSL